MVKVMMDNGFPVRYIKWLKTVTLMTCIVMFFAMFGGGVVTRTESGLGCGNEWPTCHGKWVPAHTLASVIEYSHRAISALAGLLSLFSFFFLLKCGRKRKDVQFFSLLTLIFVIIQGIMGALAVVFSQSSAVMALHFGFALIAFASAVMMVFGVWGKHFHTGSFGQVPVRVSRPFCSFVWCVTIYTYFVVYTGAIVSHTNSAAGCLGFPLCNGQIIPRFSSTGVALAYAHRIAAIILFILIAALAHFAYHHFEKGIPFRKLGILAFIFIGVQMAVGVGLVFTIARPEIYMFFALAHMLVIAVLFGVLCYMSFVAWLLYRSQLGNRGK